MKTDDGLEILSTVLFYGALTIALPALMLYGGGAVADRTNLTKFFVYGILAIPVVIWKLVDVYLQNRGFFEDNPELAGFGFITLHSPDQTFLGREFPNFTNWKVLLAVSTIVSLMFGALVSVNGQLAVGTPQLVSGSVSPSTTLGLAVEPAVSSETLFFNVGMLFGQIGLIYLFLFRRGVSARWSYILSHFLSWLITSVEFLLWHNFRYGGQEASQASVFLLGLLTNGFTALTHSVIPAYTLHGSGNFFSKAAKEGIFTSDVSILLAVIGIMISAAVLVHLIFNEVIE